MSDTPRTDAAIDASEPSNIREINLMVLARQLEREIDQTWNIAIEAAAKEIQDSTMVCETQGEIDAAQDMARQCAAAIRSLKR